MKVLQVFEERQGAVVGLGVFQGSADHQYHETGAAGLEALDLVAVSVLELGFGANFVVVGVILMEALVVDVRRLQAHPEPDN